MRNFRLRLRRLFDKLLNRCSICGARRSKRTPNDVHSQGPWCRTCNKREMFGTIYGTSPNEMKELYKA